MLGRAYAIAGQVVEGDQLGRTLGAPTANLDVRGLVLPPNGVYAVHADVKGQCYRGAANLGVRPIVEADSVLAPWQAAIPQRRFKLQGIAPQPQLHPSIRADDGPFRERYTRLDVLRFTNDARMPAPRR